MAQAGPNVARRTLFAALLAAPAVSLPAVGAAPWPLRPGNIWVQVPEEAWRGFVASVRALE